MIKNKRSLKFPEDEFKFIVDNSPNAILVLDENYKFIYVNEQVGKFLMVPKEDLIGTCFLNYVREHDIDWIRNRYLNRLKGEKEPDSYLLSILRKNGDTLYFQVNVKKIVGPDKKNYILANLLNITQRKEIELNLKKSGVRLRKFMDSAPASVVLLNPDLKFIEINSQGLKNFNLKKDEIIGKSLEDYLPDMKVLGLERAFLEVIDTGKNVAFEDLILPNIKNKHFDLHAFKVEDGLGMILLDITKRKKIEQKLKDAMESKSKLFSIVSHELRTPLTAIKESLSIVLDGSAGQINLIQENFLEMTKRNVDRLHRLINEVLDFAKLEYGKLNFNIKKNNLVKVIQEVKFTHNSIANEKNLYLKTKLEVNLKYIKFDSDKIIQVLTNLVNNAIKFTEKGGILIQTVTDENYVNVCVQDTGIGIKKTDQSKLFKSYSQVGVNRYQESGGTGLGLLICKEIVEGHDGKIWIESIYRKGTKVIFTLPIN